MERSRVEVPQVAGGDDLTLTEGAPTTRADPLFVTERVPAADASSGSSYGFTVVVAAGLTGLVTTAGVGRWTNAPATWTLGCSVVVFTLVLVTGVFVPGLGLARRS
ncbi:hypothetical protein [Actinomadura rudentiformis]|uniref:Uncharacterized protein n=1 Tax=Actinomadura rudentiformis TaxID=359158 RepID=A0A6H9YSD0_9ACTN|nr:hypothetical protein [Actinomadura rudentiformis]KAB2342433.1 hypothetical protein F8566_38450 [Actinomadura rudentiformis]